MFAESIIVLLVLGASVGPLAVLSWRYFVSPAARWKRRVLAAVREHERRRRAARRVLSAGPDRHERALRAEYLDRHFRSVSVDELAKYPGIGPVTVSRLKDSGLTNLDALARGRLGSVPGVGPSRQKDIRKALAQASREAESRFNAGACPEAVAFEAERKKQSVEQTRQREEAARGIRESDAAIAYLEPARQVASRVSFLGFLLRRPVLGWTQEIRERPLAIPAEKPVAKLAPEPTPPASPVRETSRLESLEAVVRFGFAVAKADGRIAAAERKQVRAFVERRYANSPELASQVERVLQQVDGSVPSLHEAAAGVKKAIPADAWPELYQFAVSIADAAGERNTREIECLARVAEELGIATKPAPVPIAVSPPLRADTAFTESDSRAVLEIAAETSLSAELIRRQYHLLSDRFAVEKFANHGPEFVQMAAEKRDRIERAARHLLAEYNEPLEPPQPAPPTDLRHNPDLDEVFGG